MFKGLIVFIADFIFLTAVCCWPYNPMEVLASVPPFQGEWQFGVTTDLHTPAVPHSDYLKANRDLQNTLLSKNIRLLLNMGDIINWPSINTDITEWAKFEELWSLSRRTIAHFIAPGNHDVHMDGGTVNFDNYIRINGFPGQTREKMDYTFDYGRVRFISLNKTFFVYRDGQYEWVRPDQRRVDEIGVYLDSLFDDAIGKVDHIVIFQHISPYSPQNRDDQDGIVKLKIMYDLLLEKYPNGKDFTITSLHGHDHMYYRTLRHGFIFSGGPSGGFNGNWHYSGFLEKLQNNPAILDLQDGVVYSSGERCYWEVTVNGNTIKFQLAAFSDCHNDGCVPSLYDSGAIREEYSFTQTKGMSAMEYNNSVFETIQTGAYPNPFSNRTIISLAVMNPRQKNVKVNIFNITGNLIFSSNCSSDSYIWDGRDNNGVEIGKGVFFYGIETNGKQEKLQKLILW